MSEQLMTQEELAFRWKISEATLERDRSLKQGCRYLKIGGLIRYKMQDVLEYEDACTHEPKAAKLREKNSQPAAPAIPEGWKLVPVEPTESMMRAAQKAEHDHSDFEDWLDFEGNDLKRTFKAMLAAAPEQKNGGMA